MTQAEQPEALRLAEQCDNAPIAACLSAQHHRILELEGSVTHLENVYGAAIRKVVELEQGKCLHQIAEPAQDARTAFEAISRFMKCEWSLDWDPAGFYDDAKTDAAFTWFEQGYMRAQQAAAPLAAVHPDDAAVDALAALMKAKLALQRAKGYGGWNDKTQCPQQRLSDMLRAHVDKGDPVDVANFCAMLSARGEGIAQPVAKNLTAPSVSPADVESAIDSEHYYTGQIAAETDSQHRALGGIMNCTLVMKNGHLVNGEALLQDLSKPDPERAMASARRRAFDKAYDMVVYAERQRLAGTAQPAAQRLEVQQYRLIKRGELIEAGDQFLRDDFTWQIDPRGIFVGMPHHSALRPARRSIAAQAKQGGA